MCPTFPNDFLRASAAIGGIELSCVGTRKSCKRWCVYESERERVSGCFECTGCGAAGRVLREGNLNLGVVL